MYVFLIDNLSQTRIARNSPEKISQPCRKDTTK
jgi:hypothetical protein